MILKFINVVKLLVFLFFSSTTYGQSIKESLRAAKNNKPNLEQVLSHYQKRGEIEKYKAAVFLIENMPIHKSENIVWLDKNQQTIEFSEFDFPDYKIAYNYLKSLKDSIGVRPAKMVEYDVKKISSELLIEHIDLAFYEWKNNPWSQHYSFEIFCEYILPYRSLHESLEPWRKDLKNFINQSTLKFIKTTDPTEACTHIISHLENFTFITRRPDPTPTLSARQMLFRKQGSCPDLANFSVLLCRSKGVAASFDFTPHYAASSNRHFWNTVVDKHGKHIPFNSNAINSCNNCLPYLYKADKKRLGKVFRLTYAIQKESLANRLHQYQIPNSFLQQKNIKDVTSEYVSVSPLILNKNKFKDSIAYVSVYNLGKWKTIAWGAANQNKMIFKDLGRDLVYLPSGYVQQEHQYVRYPYWINKQGISKELSPNFTDTYTAILNRKNELKNQYLDFNTLEIIAGDPYTLRYWDNGWKILGISKATTKGVRFQNIPTDALLNLSPPYPDGFERNFLIQKDTHQLIWY